eukprot:351779-Chlamydomonas_euryale.AAC.2
MIILCTAADAAACYARPAEGSRWLFVSLGSASSAEAGVAARGVPTLQGGLAARRHAAAWFL